MDRGCPGPALSGVKQQLWYRLIRKLQWALVSSSFFILFNIFIISYLMGKQRSFSRYILWCYCPPHQLDWLHWDPWSVQGHQWWWRLLHPENCHLEWWRNCYRVRPDGSCSPSLKAVLANSAKWSLDGTFNIKKLTLFFQLSSFLISLFNIY